MTERITPPLRLAQCPSYRATLKRLFTLGYERGWIGADDLASLIRKHGLGGS